MQFRLFLFCAIALAVTGRATVERVNIPASASLATFNLAPAANAELLLSCDATTERIALPANTRDIAFKRVPRGWLLYANDLPVWQRWGVATTNAVTLSHASNMLPENDRDEYVQKLAPFAFSDGFMVAEGEDLPQHWEILRGQWGLSSVTNSFETGNRRQNRNQPTAARSPNYYSAVGYGTNALVVTGETFHEHYMLRASVQHNAGRNGIAFMVTDNRKFFTLTALTEPVTEQIVIELREHNDRESRLLDRVFTELRPGQWLLMEARVTDDEVLGFVDNVQVLRVKCELPAGGRYGLYSDGLEEHEATRFDDVECVSHQDYALNTSEAMTRMTIWEGVNLVEVGPEDARCWEKPEGVFQAGRMFGTSEDSGHLLSVRFLVREPNQEHILNLKSGEYWFAVCRENGLRVAKLARKNSTDGDATCTCKEYDTFAQIKCDLHTPIVTAVLTEAQGKFTTLTLDTSRPGEIRGLVDGKLVLLHLTREEPRGTAGIGIQGNQAILHNTPTYTTLAPVYVDRVEKNTQYTTDPFMRHWASAEGQWHINREKETWLRGDTLGKIRIQLPVTREATLFIGLDETSLANADVRVELREKMLSAYLPDTTNPVWSVSVADLPQTAFEQPKGNKQLYTVGLEDYVLWAGCETGMLAVATLPHLPQGRRVRLEGVPLDELRFSRVRRENVFDSLFNESLYAWVLNGGQWETVARFQCDPTWSHMNGENKTGLAALWGKYEFTGDFSIEFFAGMRMGWYERGGDLNMTVMNAQNAPASGYTVVTTGWDPDNSQTLSRLFRNGVCVTNTTAYAVPRNREGQVRKAGYEPLISGGRDMHGAWYGMRLRRVGEDLAYLFDNEPLLTWRDDAPLAGGGFGIWTFQNSMMVARARIVAESMKPRTFKFWRGESPTPPAAPLPAPEGLRIGGLPPNLLSPANWEPADPISHPQTTFFQNGFKTTSTAAGGTFLTHANRATIPTASLLGFDFEFAFSPDTRVNFEFSSGAPAEKGGLESPAEWSFPLTGTREKRGTRLILPPPANELVASADAEKPVWNRVTLWLPSPLLSAKNTHLQIDGFGNLQTSDIQQGLDGNLPGAWYSVRNLRPVWNGVPTITAPGHTVALEDLHAQLTAFPPGQLHTFDWPKEFSSVTLPPIAWAIPKVGEFELIAEPDATMPGFVRIRSAATWNSPLMPPQKVLINDEPAAFITQQNDALILLPAGVTGSVNLDITLADGRTWRTKSATYAAPEKTPPRLVSLDASRGKYVTFATSLTSPIPVVGNASTSITPVPGRGNVFTIANRGASRRLDALLEAQYDPVATPLIQFNYSGTPSSAVTLSYGNHRFRFTENQGHASTLTQNPALPDPDVWNSFLLMPLANLPGLRLGNAESITLSPGTLNLASRGNPDQTGLWSSLNIDSIAFGPALQNEDWLDLRPRYASPSKIFTISCSLLSGNLPYAALSDEQRDTLTWKSNTSFNHFGDFNEIKAWIHLNVLENVLRPTIMFNAPPDDIADCPFETFDITDGVNHFLFRATDEHGNESEVTSFPFLYVRTAPALSFNASDLNPNGNNNLNIRISSPASPPLLRNAKLTCDGADINFANGQNTLNYSRDAMLTLNWPFTLRREIQRTSDGDTLRLVLSNVVDLAGNVAPPLEIPVKIDYAADTTPPTVVTIQRPVHIAAWVPAFNAASDLFDFFQDTQIERHEHIVETNGLKTVRIGLPPKQRNVVLRRNFGQNRSNPLNLGEHPRFALSLRLNSETLPSPSFKIIIALRNPPASAPRPTENNLHIFDVPNPELKPGEWRDLIMDLPSFFPDVAPADLNLETLGLRINSEADTTTNADTLSFRAIAIFGSPGAERADITVDAYDASGIRGLKFFDAPDDAPFAPTRLRPDAFPPRTNPNSIYLFRSFQIHDRAGNASQTYIIPEAK